MLALLLGSLALVDGKAERVAASLGLFAGVPAPHKRSGDCLAFSLPRVDLFPPRSQRARSPLFRSVRRNCLDDGRIVLFHGEIDNRAELLRELPGPSDDASLYARAIQAWGNDAEPRIMGEYCSIIAAPGKCSARLARSPLRAPPLHYFFDSETIGAASVPRALEAMGLERRLDHVKLADSYFFNLVGEKDYIDGSYIVRPGEIVEISRGRRTASIWYDPCDLPVLRRIDRREAVEEADRLLTTAARISIAGSNDPGITLTGGLDTSNIAARLVRFLEPGQTLKSFTYVPLAEHGVAERPGYLIDEQPAVEAFAALHPQIEPHFIENREIAFDHRLEQLFLATGNGSPHAVMHFRFLGLYAQAQAHGVRTMLQADGGNQTFSCAGDWAYGEFLRTGRFVQLHRALQNDTLEPRPYLRRLLSRAVAPHLPDRLWRFWKRVKGTPANSANAEVAAVRADAFKRYDIIPRIREAGMYFERDQYVRRSQMIRDNFGRGDCEGSDLLQGFEQLYEIRTRDVPMYRPLVEFCLSLPTDMYMHDGISRWLGRELGRGLMPEAQRMMPGIGIQHTDWHARLTPLRDELRSEIGKLRSHPILGEIVDVDRLEADLDRWPDKPTLDNDAYFACAVRVPRTIAMARFVRYMTGENEA